MNNKKKTNNTKNKDPIDKLRESNYSKSKRGTSKLTISLIVATAIIVIIGGSMAGATWYSINHRSDNSPDQELMSTLSESRDFEQDGNIQEAINVLEERISTLGEDPDRSTYEWYLRLGELKTKSDNEADLEGAYQAFEKALSYFDVLAPPQSPDAPPVSLLHAAANMARATGNNAKAAIYYNQALVRINEFESENIDELEQELKIALDEVNSELAASTQED